MRRIALVIRVQHDDTGRLIGQIVDPSANGPVPFGNLAELWLRLLECLHLPVTGLPPAAEHVDRRPSEVLNEHDKF